MTIEIQRRKSTWIFRIDPKDACIVERRVNRSAARWYFFGRRATPEETRQYLLQLEKEVAI